ncbi:MAG: ribosomal RNA small subunit methyltransferase A [Deltaproteobacteria bacterium]|nr:ribosomal RNA small subunit methyltransferase A [Deltaproteobacteria bacterium]
MARTDRGDTGPGPAALLRSLDASAQKALGQHFLASPSVASSIVRLAGVVPGSRVLEIGPGLGALTRLLVQAGAEVVAVEQDPALARWIRKTFPSVQVVKADALGLDVEVLCPGTGWWCVSNLPYNVGTHLVGRLARLPGTFCRLVVMLQREVGERIVARPGSRTYGALSVEMQARAEASLLLRVRPGAFHPPPRVASVVVRLDLGPRMGSVDPARFDAVVRAAFSTRRKTVRNALGAAFGIRTAEEALAAAGVDPGTRAETLDVEAFSRIASALYP